MTPLKILHIITDFDSIYGAQKHVIECLKDHLEKGYSCKVVTGNKGIAGKLVESLGIEVIEMNSLERAYNIVNDIKVIKNVIQLIRSFKPDIVISHSTKAGVVARIACFKCKLPNIFTVHGWAFEKGTPMVQKVVGWTIEYALKFISDSYWCVSNYTAKYGINNLKLDDEKIFISPPLHQEFNIVSVVSKSQFANKEKVILMVAGFRNQKDHYAALSSIKILSQRRSNIKLLLLGGGENKEKIQKLTEEYKIDDKVILLGERPNVQDYYLKADIVILPSFYEGLPITLLEAAQFGKPLIASNVGGIAEILIDNKNGLLLRKNDPVILAEYLEQILYDEEMYNKMSAFSIAYYSENFSEKTCRINLQNIIEKAIKRTRYLNI